MTRTHSNKNSQREYLTKQCEYIFTILKNITFYMFNEKFKNKF